MKRKLYVSAIILLLSVSNSLVYSQATKKIKSNFIESSLQEVLQVGTPQIAASDYKIYKLDVSSMKDQLIGIAHTELNNNGFIASVKFPHVDGTFHDYLAKENNTMHPTLAANFPEIKSYDAYSEDNSVTVKWDITAHGFHAMIMIPGQNSIFIDPIIKGNSEYYIVYNSKDIITDKVMECGVGEESILQKKNSPAVKSFGTCEKRTYRLALAATGEYTTFHGGTVALALAAQVTTMNRVNGVYEREMAIHMTIIANNNLIIYTNSGSDPYTNNNGSTMLGQNQTNLTNVIGSANYDIGHVFSTGGGGIAQLYSPCSSSSKAKGVTGSSAPIGDAFDIDYVAHEMGHQFGANHTFNNNSSGSCSGNANSATSYEPGSGTTIMAYAGICTAAFDVQSNSDDYFQSASLAEIGAFITGGSHTCPVKTALSNTAPVVLPVAGVAIPQGTPFFLTASASDVDGNAITYCWEEMDAGISTTTPTATQTTKTNFRTFDPTTSPTRYFPSLSALASNGPYTWEVLPTVARTMNFRVTVRDNAPNGGCNDEENMAVTVASSGPFVVTYPTATGISWLGASTQTVTWNVAGTTGAPVNCANVDILLSIDGGLTYPTVLVTNTPNDGTQVINVPNTPSTTCRIMVRANAGYFFDISNNNFTITAATFDYTLASTPSSISICQGNDAVYAINVGSIGGYNSAVTLSVSGLPGGATSSFSTNPVTPVGSSNLTITNTAGVTPGTYTITINSTSTSGPKVNTVTLVVSNGNPSAVSQISPANGATSIDVPTTFTWSTAPEVGVSYSIQIATDAAFTSIVDQASGLTSATFSSSLLTQNTVYYWKVRSSTGCGSSAWSSNYSFTSSSCYAIAATSVPVSISASGTPTVTSTINVAASGTINDVNVLNLIGTHTYVSDLTITITSPQGTSVTLFTGICTNNDNFSLNFDDAAASATISCPPTSGLTYKPNQVLTAFNGQNSAGVWTLTISDGFDQDGGTLTSWSLKLCLDACTAPATPSSITGSTTVCSGATGIVYSVPVVSGATSYTWTVPSGASITAGQGTTSATVTFGSTSGNVSVTAANACGTSSASTSAITVNSIPAVPGTITGSGTVCSGSTGNGYSITAVPGATSYTWTVPAGATITAGQGTTSATVTFGAIAGNVTVTATNACGTSSSSTKAITISTTPSTPAAITGSTTVCSGLTGNVYSISAVSGATSYTWTVPSGATITAGQGTTSATVTFGSTSGNVSVTATNSCGTSGAATTAVTINTAPATPGAITGSTTVCSGSIGNVYSISTVSGATSYTWTVPSGATITAGQGTTSATVTFGSTSGNVTVTATNSCGTSSAAATAVTVNSAPATPGAITGSSTVCSGSTGNVYSITAVSGATSYTWTAPAGATITAGQGTTSATITFGATSGNVTVTATNSCGTSSASTQSITFSTSPSTPGAITGSTTVCSGSTGNVYLISAVSGATTYTWTVPAGSTITSGQGTTAATVSFGSASGNITVTATNSCGTSSASSASVIVNSVPSTPGTISGSATVCSGSTGNVYSISAVSGATSYSWSVPAGATITAGQGTTSATITFGSTSGNITVTATNTCGSSSSSSSAIAVNSVPATPGTITGSATACSGSTGNVYSISAVSGATSYTWSVPSGATITAGQGTTSATVSFGATSGNVTVSASNACGTSSNSNFAVTLNSSAPGTPGAISGTASVCEGSTGVVYSISTVSGATNYTWTVPAGASITSGQGTTSVTVDFGSVSGNISVAASSTCGTSSSNSLAITVNAIPSAPIVNAVDNCGNSTLSTTASGSLLWSTNETTSSITVLSSGIYTVTQTVNGCTSSAASVTANPSTVPSAPLVSGSDNCGNSVLTATGTGSILWSNSQTTASITVTSPGTYSVTQTENGCTSTPSTITASPLTVPMVSQTPISDVCINTPTFAITGGSPAGGTYSGTGISSNNFDPSVAGYGTFVVTYDYTESNGCSSSAQETITVGCAGIEEENNTEVSIYPNPSNGIFQITSGEEINRVEIFDAAGRLVRIISNENPNELLEIDMKDNAQGVYSLDIKTLNHTTRKRVVINN